MMRRAVVEVTRIYSHVLCYKLSLQAVIREIGNLLLVSYRG